MFFKIMRVVGIVLIISSIVIFIYGIVTKETNLIINAIVLLIANIFNTLTFHLLAERF